MIRIVSNILILLITFLILGSRPVAPKQQQRPFEGLIAAADAVVAVEILSTDYTATPADGPMVAAARVLKALKGPITSGKEFRFSETAWVGPAYQKGEHRILFLEKAASSESPSPTKWRILSRMDARIDFFIEKKSLSGLSVESLESFLKRLQESKDTPKKVLFGKGALQ